MLEINKVPQTKHQERDLRRQKSEPQGSLAATETLVLHHRHSGKTREYRAVSRRKEQKKKIRVSFY